MHFHPTPEGSGYSRAKYRKAEKTRGTLLFHAPSINQLRIEIWKKKSKNSRN